MATKLKGFNRSAGTKVILTLIFLFSIGGVFSALNYAYLNDVYYNGGEYLIEPDYIQSSNHQNDVNNAFYRVYDVFAYYELYDENYIEYSEEDYNDYTYTYEEIMALSEGFNFGYMYQRSDGDELFKNVLYSEQNGCYYYYEKDTGKITKGSNTGEAVTLSNLPIYNSHRIAVSFSDEYLAQKSNEWTMRHNLTLKIAVIISLCILISIVSLIWLIWVIGMGRDKQLLPMKKINSFFVEIYIAVAVFALYSWLVFEDSFFIYRLYQSSRMGRFYETSNIVGAGAATSIFGLIVLWALLSCVIILKNKRLKKSLLTYIVLKWLWQRAITFAAFIKRLITGEAYYNCKPAKTMIYRAAALLGITLLNFLLIIAAIDSNFESLTLLFLLLEISAVGLYFYGAWLLFRDYSNLEKHIDDVFKGNYSSDNKLPENSPYSEASKKLSSIASGYHSSLDEKIKSERMKIDLVTNVSHDLKTPLTSIIGYVELLSKEKDLSDEAKEYIRILSLKSERLKNIVSDVFELAKTTSGEINVELEKIDLNRLTVQTIAEMEDRISESELTVKTKLPDTPVYVLSDGKKLYRVMLNLIDNALKYSLEKTRIFIEIKTDNNTAILEIKNIAGYEMNFTKEDILERFSRGDKSRSTEGNGLGLSIAQGFTTACGGKFDIDIDGDLFKAVLKFPMIS